MAANYVSSLPRPVSFGQTFPLSLCHLFVVPSLRAWLGAVPTVAQPAARWGRRHACNLAELSQLRPPTSGWSLACTAYQLLTHACSSQS